MNYPNLSYRVHYREAPCSIPDLNLWNIVFECGQVTRTLRKSHWTWPPFQNHKLKLRWDSKGGKLNWIGLHQSLSQGPIGQPYEIAMWDYNIQQIDFFLREN